MRPMPRNGARTKNTVTENRRCLVIDLCSAYTCNYVYLPHSELMSVLPMTHISGKQVQHKGENLNAELWQQMTDIQGVETDPCLHLSVGSILQ